MPLDPQAKLLLDQMAAMGTPPLQAMSVPDARAFIDSMRDFSPEVDAASRMVIVESKLDLTSEAKSRLYSGAIARVSVADDEP